MNCLLDSGFPAVLCQVLFEFCTRPTRVASGLEEFSTVTEDSDKPDDSNVAESAAAGRPASKLYCICIVLQMRDYGILYLLTERLGQYCYWSGCRGFFFPPLRLTRASAKSSNSIIFKFLVLIQQ